MLTLASDLNRILVSHDTSTMPVHFAGFLRAGLRSPGVLLVRQRVSATQAIEAILINDLVRFEGRGVGAPDRLSSVNREAYISQMNDWSS